MWQAFYHSLQFVLLFTTTTWHHQIWTFDHNANLQMWIFHSQFLLWNRSYRFEIIFGYFAHIVQREWNNRERLPILQSSILRLRFRRRHRAVVDLKSPLIWNPQPWIMHFSVALLFVQWIPVTFHGIPSLNKAKHLIRSRFTLRFCSNLFMQDCMVIQDGDQQKGTHEKELVKIFPVRKRDWVF